MSKPTSVIVVDGVRYVPESVALVLARQAAMTARLATLIAARTESTPAPRTVADRVRESFAEHPKWTFVQHARFVGVSKQRVQQIAAKVGYKSPRAHAKRESAR